MYRTNSLFTILPKTPLFRHCIVPVMWAAHRPLNLPLFSPSCMYYCTGSERHSGMLIFPQMLREFLPYSVGTSFPVCMYLGWTPFCPVLMIEFPHLSALFDYQTSPPLPVDNVIMTLISPSLKLVPDWPVCWQRFPASSGVLSFPVSSWRYQVLEFKSLFSTPTMQTLVNTQNCEIHLIFLGFSFSSRSKETPKNVCILDPHSRALKSLLAWFRLHLCCRQCCR